MTRRSASRACAAAFILALSVSLGRAQEEATTVPSPDQQQVLRIAKEVRKQIVTLPQYGVFDNIHFGIKGSDTVVLLGQASRPTLKSGAEKVVSKIEGVKSVDNQIEVLPASPNDDRIRAAVYASIYRYPALQKYTSNRGGPRGVPSVARAAGGITNDPPLGYHAIHIIVKNGNVTLTGVVDSDTDLAIAEMRANGVPGVFSVDNDLQVTSKAK
jgi:hyperosmotically inducible periplasmic protein